MALGDILVGTKQHPRGLASQTPPHASTQPSSTTALDTMSALGAFASAPTAALGARSRVFCRGALGTNDAKTIGIRPPAVRIPGPRAQAVSTAVELLPPAIANPDSCSRANEFTVRKGAVPYKDEAVDCDIFVNEGAREAIRANGAERFVHLIEPNNPKLLKLLKIMEDGWDRIGVRAKNAGHHSLWPEAFEAGKALLEEAFPEECDPAYGGEVLSGVAFVGDDMKDRAIDFMQRRPKTDFTMSKYNPLGRLHRDPDAIDYKQPGWMEAAMPGSGAPGDEDGYSYRYYNVWLARTPLDPSGQVWENPLCLLLPKEKGAREWTYEIRTPEDNEGVTEETLGEKAGRIAKNPLSAAPIIMKAFSFKKTKKEDQFEFQDENYMKRGSPELVPDDEHVWVTHPFVCFDSFDMWHGAAKWSSESAKSDIKAELCNGAKDVMRARQDASKGRVSMELRFRARCKPAGVRGGREGVPFSPLSSAYRGGAFKPDTVRPSGGAYDLEKGTTK